jgi:hypothetical protein
LTRALACHDLILAGGIPRRGGKGPLAHPSEPAYPCCLPALGELAGINAVRGVFEAV